MTLSATTLEKVVRGLSKIQFLEIKLKDVQYIAPAPQTTLEDQIRAIDSQIGDARHLSYLESWSREKYESIVNPLKLQLYSLIKQNSDILSYNNSLILAASLDYESRCDPIRTQLSTTKDNFIAFLKSVSVEVLS